MVEREGASVAEIRLSLAISRMPGDAQIAPGGVRPRHRSAVLG
jgi:hypothetical protein